MTAEQERSVYAAIDEWQKEKPPAWRHYRANVTDWGHVKANLWEYRPGSSNQVSKFILFTDTEDKPLTPERIKALIDDPLGDA